MNAFVHEIIGWIGGICLGICAVPQALQSIKNKHSRGVNGWFLLLWAVGELAALAYVAPMASYPLIANYLLNLLLIGIIGIYKVGTED